MKLALAQKGPVSPPPSLTGPAGRVASEIASWPRIIAATHWHLVRTSDVDGADFYVGDRELGHIHLDGEMHLASVPHLSEPLVAAGIARPFRFGGSYSGWVEASIKDDSDADNALFMFDLNYQRHCGLPMSRLVDQIAVRASVRNTRAHG